MGNKQRPRYWDVIVHVVDRPLKDEAYLSPKELIEEVTRKLDLPDGIYFKNARAILKECK